MSKTSLESISTIGLIPQTAEDAKRIAADTIALVKTGDISLEEAKTVTQLLTLFRDFSLLEEENRPHSLEGGLTITCSAGCKTAPQNAPSPPADTTSASRSTFAGTEGLPPLEGSKAITFFKLKYLRFLEQTHSAKYRRDAVSAFSWLLNKTGDLLLGDLRPGTLESAFAEDFIRASHGTSRHYRTLKAAFNKAVQWEMLAENPFIKFRLPKIPDSPTPYLDEDGLRRVLEHTTESVLAQIYTFAFYTGMRMSEILNLRWDAVDMGNRWIAVNNSKQFTTKSKRNRTIPVGESLYAVLLEMKAAANARDSNGFVFVKADGTQFKVNHVSHRFKEAVRDAGLPDRLHFHSLRHSFASNLISRGTNPVHVKELMGHANLSTTMRYTHVQVDDLRKAVEKLG